MLKKIEPKDEVEDDGDGIYKFSSFEEDQNNESNQSKREDSLNELEDHQQKNIGRKSNISRQSIVSVSDETSKISFQKKEQIKNFSSSKLLSMTFKPIVSVSDETSKIPFQKKEQIKNFSSSKL